jgi:WhiB family transcriptional regulator, redox-sensing transcriptional regulator
VEFVQIPAWVEGGACGVVVDPDSVFFPIRGGSSKAPRAICATCSERIPCLTFALEHHEVFGIWGGTSDRERRQLRQQKARYEKTKNKAVSPTRRKTKHGPNA